MASVGGPQQLGGPGQWPVWHVVKTALVLPSDFTFQKSKMAATTAILNFCLMATTRLLLAIACIGTKFDVEIKIRGISIEITNQWFFII